RRGRVAERPPSSGRHRTLCPVGRGTRIRRARHSGRLAVHGLSRRQSSEYRNQPDRDRRSWTGCARRAARARHRHNRSGRARQAVAEGKPIPEGIAIDPDGKATTDARQALAVLSIGGPKGSGLSLMFECLTGILAGTPIIAPPSGAKGPIQNAMIIVFNIANFRSSTDYRRDIQQLKDLVKALPRRDGFSELLLPGERGDREAELRRRTGIPLPVKLWTELGDLAQGLRVSRLGPS